MGPRVGSGLGTVILWFCLTAHLHGHVFLFTYDCSKVILKIRWRGSQRYPFLSPPSHSGVSAAGKWGPLGAWPALPAPHPTPSSQPNDLKGCSTLTPFLSLPPSVHCTLTPSRRSLTSLSKFKFKAWFPPGLGNASAALAEADPCLLLLHTQHPPPAFRVLPLLVSCCISSHIFLAFIVGLLYPLLNGGIPWGSSQASPYSAVSRGSVPSAHSMRPPSFSPAQTFCS